MTMAMAIPYDAYDEDEIMFSHPRKKLILEGN
jgi:hypothetical protein